MKNRKEEAIRKLRECCLSCRTGDADFEEAYREGLEQARRMIVSWIDSLGRDAA